MKHIQAMLLLCFMPTMARALHHLERVQGVSLAANLCIKLCPQVMEIGVSLTFTMGVVEV